MPKKRSTFRLKLELYAVKLIIGALGLFPYKTSLKIGETFGRSIVRVFPKLAKTSYRNVELAFPELDEKERKEIAHGTFTSLGRHLGFISHMNRFQKEDIRNLIEVRGKENFYDSAETGKGIIFFTGHFGSWEVFNLLPPAFDLRINILVRRIDNPLVEDYVDKMRTRFGSVTLGKRQAPRKMFDLLENGEVVGILADLNAQLHDGVFVDFFDVPACTTKSIAKFALRSEAIILPAFAVWEDDRYVVHLGKAVDYEVTEDKDADILAITKSYTKVVEEYVRKYPEQWLWIHKRWQTRKKGEDSLY